MVVDGFTALGTASAALEFAKTAQQLYRYLSKLYRNTKVVSEAVRRLANEVRAVGEVCTLINQEIDSLDPVSDSAPARQYDKDGLLWESIDSALENCNAVVDDLKLIVGEVEQERSNMLMQARRQMLLDKRKDELEDIRNRLHTHTQSLQMALQMVNIKVAHLAPKFASQDLVVKIEELKSVMGKHEWSPDEAMIVRCAKDIINHDTTLYEDSIADGSVRGGAQGASSNLRVVEWAGDVESLRRDVERSRSSEADSQAPTIFTEGGTQTTSTAPTTAVNATGEQTPSELDDDDEFLPKTAQLSLQQGQQAFDEKDWKEPESFLREALEDIKRLPEQLRGQCDLFDLEYKLAVCAYYTRELPVARDALIEVVNQSPSSDQHKALVYNSGHLLALLHIRMDELERARLHCESTLKARRRLLGEEHESYFQSRVLLARIFELKGNLHRARIQFAMIPEDRRASLLEQLSLPGPPPSALAQSPAAGPVREQTITSTVTPGTTKEAGTGVLKETENSVPLRSPGASSFSQGPSASTDTLSTTAGPHSGTQLDDKNQRRSSELPLRAHPRLEDLAIKPSGGSVAGEPVSEPVTESGLEDTAATKGRLGSMSASKRKTLIESLPIVPADDIEKAICSGQVDAALALVRSSAVESRSAGSC